MKRKLIVDKKDLSAALLKNFKSSCTIWVHSGLKFLRRLASKPFLSTMVIGVILSDNEGSNIKAKDSSQPKTDQNDVIKN